MIGSLQKIKTMKILETPEDISASVIGVDTLQNDAFSGGAHQGVMLCQEVQVKDKAKSGADSGEIIGNTALPNTVEFKWLVAVPKYLSRTCGVSGEGIPSDKEVSPPYKSGEIIYCGTLDLPIVMQNSVKDWKNTHPSMDGSDPTFPLLFNLAAVRGHYGNINISPVTQMILWIDLNLDGRSRGAGSSTASSTAQNVWL